MRRMEMRVLGALLAATVLSTAATGQGDRRGTMVIAENDNRHALSYAEPDIDLIVQPYVNRADVSTFVEELDLSEAQRAAVQRLINAYIEDFRALLKEQHPDPEGAAHGRGLLGDAGDNEEVEEGGPGGGGADADAESREKERSEMQSILLEELKADGIVKDSLDELPVEPSFGVGVSVFRPGEDGVQPPPEVNVSISFGSEDDRLGEALREKLERAAQRAVPRIAEAVRERMVAEHKERVSQSPSEAIQEKWDELQALRERVAAFKKEHEALLTKLYSNVKRLLSAAQLERWPAIERTLRRIKTLPWGQLAGESTDLIALTDEMELSDSQRAALSETLASYERQLDAALKRRNAMLETADQEIDVALYSGDYDDALSTARRLARARVAIRDLNDRTIDLLSAQLEGRAGRAFRRTALATSYPRIYRRTVGQQAFDEVILIDDLDGDLQMAVLELAERHGQLIGEVNDRLHRSLRREQQRELTRSVERAIATLQDRSPELEGGRPAIARAFQERRDIDVRYMKMLYDILPESVVATLPEIPVHEVGERVEAEHRDAVPQPGEY